MSWAVSRCPKCDAEIRSRDIRAAGPFSCPNCSSRLQAPEAYARWIGLGNVLVTGLAFRLLGFDHLHLLYAVLLDWFPVQVVALRVVRYAVPPRLREYLPRQATLRLR